MSAPLTERQERHFLLTLAGIQFSHVLDFMIVMPLGPVLMRALAIDTHEFGLLVASYSFSAAASGVLAASFIDRYERRRALLVVFVLFGLATLACALAPGYATLLAARGLAGAFGGVLGALIHTMVGDAIPFVRRAQAAGVVSAAFSVASVAGVPLSLWLANLFDWRAPFLFVAAQVVLLILFGRRFLPELSGHLDGERPAHPLAALAGVLAEANHLRALLFSAMVIFSGFTVIPYITVYAVGNVGIAQQDIPLVYLVGGFATLTTARRIGRWADRAGKVKIYRTLALAALVPLAAVTHMPAVPLWAWIACTTAFFVLVSGRMVPAMAVIASAAQPKVRGAFMSLNATVQSLAMGCATAIAGFVVAQDAAGQLVGYPTVGYVAIAANLAAIGFVGTIVMHGMQPGAKAPS